MSGRAVELLTFFSCVVSIYFKKYSTRNLDNDISLLIATWLIICLLLAWQRGTVSLLFCCKHDNTISGFNKEVWQRTSPSSVKNVPWIVRANTKYVLWKGNQSNSVLVVGSLYKTFSPLLWKWKQLWKAWSLV